MTQMVIIGGGQAAAKPSRAYVKKALTGKSYSLARNPPCPISARLCRKRISPAP